MIRPLAAQGKIAKYSATPEYQGKSFIPISIDVFAHSGEFRTRMNVWGEALTRGERG